MTGRAAGVRGVTTAGRTAGGARGARRPSDRTAGPAAAVDGATALKLETAPQPVAEPRLRVAPPAPVRVPRARFVAAVVGVVVAGVFGILIINTKTNQNTFVIDDLRQQQAALTDQEQQLDRQLDVLGSAGSLHAAANRLGLVASGTPAYIRLPDGKVLLVPKPGEGPQSRAYQEPPQQQTQQQQTQQQDQQGAQQPGTQGTEAQVQQQGAGR
ncbi:hypothetical protein [Spirilliplanes yamanashiensis]|nr:hypothetical protein [Spirilliplanes yamanashiensis]